MTEEKSTLIRINQKQYALLSEQAKKDRRSITKELEVALEVFFEMNAVKDATED